MIPTTRKELVNKTAKAVNMDEEFVDDIIVTYYKYISSLRDNMDYLRVNIPGLGAFYYSKKRAIRLRKVLQDRIDGLQGGLSIFRYEQLQKTLKQQEAFNKLTQAHEEEWAARNDKRKKRYEYILGNMEIPK